MSTCPECGRPVARLQWSGRAVQVNGRLRPSGGLICVLPCTHWLAPDEIDDMPANLLELPARRLAPVRANGRAA